MAFVHLHVHTQYSILDGQSSIENLFKRADELGMPALAITDHGNMYGVKEFFKFAKKHPNVKPIIGCEVYVTRHFDHNIKDNNHRGYFHLILLAKNYEGYKNLMKIVSTGHIEGKYYGKPRVSHEVLEKYAENLICCSACIAGEVPRLIINGDMEAAEKAVLWYKNLFGEDYYLEVQSHYTEVPGQSQEVYERQCISNAGIFELAEKTGVKVVATNDVHFVRKEDGPVHDRLICLNTGAFLDDPDRMRYTQQEFLKSEEEMAELFPDHPEVLANTLEVAEKIENYKIDRGHVLPKFDLPEDFVADIDNQMEKYKDVIDVGRCDSEGKDRGDEFCRSVAYLCHLTYKGAQIRYGDTFTEEQSERIDFELKTICRMGFPDYFLIVQDYIAAARAMGSMVGPGRGSAAGSVVAYCLWITNLDPIKYQLLFERFLNPDRISMPDIDVDFEDLAAAHKYVEERYGLNHVSRVITFGTMAAKSAIKDVSRISRLSIEESNRLTKMVPDRLSEMVEKEYPFNPKLDELKKGFQEVVRQVETDDPDNPGQKITVEKHYQIGKEEANAKITLKNCYRLVPEFQEELKNGSELTKEVLHYALQLEGTVRQVGVHACATIIGRGNLMDYIPICLSEDKEIVDESGKKKEFWTSQYDGHYIEDVGMLKMDFLGLNTLTIIHTCLDLIKERHGVDIDIEAIPIDDEETYKLYGRGDTTSVFQFESPGMRDWLQKLQPTRFEDLIAMNALYRPGPMDYIPSFVARKQGQEKVEYDLPEMEEFLKDTYGVTVYQEQVMLLSQKLANFTKGEADKLRKAMGKKQIDILNSLKEKFMTGGMKNGHPEKILDKIWKDWEKFAEYAFNKSHATCYAWVSYQTGYLKAHYPAEFQAANMSNNLSKIDEIKKIMDDCRKSSIKVLNPDINESQSGFNVNKDGNVRFGLGGIKGFGENIVNAIIEERGKNGLFSDIYDFVERMAGIVNRKAFESLLYSGAFDSFGYSRAQYEQPCESGDTFMEAVLRYGELYRKDKMNSEISLFGDSQDMEAPRPAVPAIKVGAVVDELEFLHKEKELVGMYLSSHPLDNYTFELENFTTCGLGNLTTTIAKASAEKKPSQACVGGFIISSETSAGWGGKPVLRAVIEDKSGSYEFKLNGKDIENFTARLQPHTSVLIEGKIDEMFFRKPEERKLKGDPPYSFKIQKIILLGNVAETYLRGFSINVSTPMLTPEFRERLVRTIKKNKGTTPLTMFLSDPQTGYRIEFLSKKFQVGVSAALINELTKMDISYTVIRK